MLARVAFCVLTVGAPRIASAQETILSVFSADEAVVAEYTLEQLDNFEQTSYRTLNEFIDEEAEFSGPLVRDVLTDAGAITTATGSVEMAAINDYTIAIPSADLENYDVIFATRMNGELMSVREKGPIWIMYPISDFPELADAIYSSRLIWQVDTATLVE